MIQIRQMEMFRAVAEEGSFTRAGSRLHVSQSAISRQVKLLEEELGAVLLHRRGRKVVLTGSGELLLAASGRVFREIQDVVSQIADTQELQRGALRLGGGMTVCMYIFPQLLKKYRSLYRKVDLRVTSGTSEAIVNLLRRRELDLALLTLPIAAKDLEVVPVLKEEMVVVTSPGHPLTRGRTVDTKSLGRYPLITFEAGSNTRKVLDRFFLDESIEASVAMETENVEIIKAMVRNGIGVTIIPYTAIARDLRGRRFSYARVRGRRLYRETGWVYLKSDYLPRAISEMLRVFDSMKQRFGGGPPSVT